MNWSGFLISFVLLGILPIWVIRLFPLDFGIKVLLTVVAAGACYWFVEHGGAKKGLFTK